MCLTTAKRPLCGQSRRHWFGKNKFYPTASGTTASLPGHRFFSDTVRLRRGVIGCTDRPQLLSQRKVIQIVFV